MIVLIALPTLFIYAVGLGITTLYQQRANRAEVEQTLSRLAASYAARFDGAFKEVAAVAEATARAIATAPDLEERQIYALLRGNVRQEPFIYGSAAAFEPGRKGPSDELYSPYVFRAPGGLREMNISRETYDWHGDDRWQWWHAPKASGRATWTDPYFDSGAGNVLMVTYAVPVRPDDRFLGVATVDVMLPTLQEYIGRQIVGELDFVILTAAGQLVFSAVEKQIMTGTIFDVARTVGRQEVAESLRRLLAREPGIVRMDEGDALGIGLTAKRDGDVWIAHAPIDSTGWLLAVLLPEREALGSVRQRTVMAVCGLIATFCLIVAAIGLVSGQLARPISTLNTAVLKIAGGDLDARVQGVGGNDEIGELAKSFNKMAGDLHSLVDRLAAERTQREKIEQSLGIARMIQQSLLPRESPTCEGFEIAGWNQPAEATGGDYYDWQVLPDGRLAVSLADVSGHGIGPALLTAVCRAYARATFSSGEGLGGLMDRVNDLLVEDLSAGRFITFVAAILDPAAVSVQLVSAGHGPMFLYRAADAQVLEMTADDIPFGITRGVGYGPPTTLDLRTGDALVLVTDGLLEWANGAGERFGGARLRDTIRAHGGLSAAAMIAGLHEAVRAYAGAAPQADDLSVVVIRQVAAPVESA